MGRPLRVLCTMGTRPEAIKMAPVILRMKERQNDFECLVLATAQHRHLLDQILQHFDITADVDLDIMTPGQELAGLTARLIERIDPVLVDVEPDWVLAQGDTSTVMVAALASYYRRVRFGHVEAGLRTHNRWEPFPEEMNRVLADQLSTAHFAPTESARADLMAEGIGPESIHITGNTVIDALLITARGELPLPLTIAPDRRLVLVTAHRRENFGKPLVDICTALKEITSTFADVELVYPVHPNPNVTKVVHEHLGGQDRIHLLEPVGYAEIVALMKRCTIILTDSGGIQEEAPTLGKPVLVLRNETERPEGIEAGTTKLVGTNREKITAEASRLLTDTAAYQAMSQVANPYGDGRAAERICDVLLSYGACSTP